MRNLLLSVLLLGCAVDPDANEDVTTDGDGDGKADGAGTACSGCDISGNCPGGEYRSACLLDPDSRWRVVAVRAQISATNHDDGAWDLGGGAPDPYVLCARSGSEAGRSPIANDTLAPAWRATICEAGGAELLRNQVAIYVYDEDDANYDDFIGLFQAGVIGIDHMGKDLTRTLYKTTAFGGSLTESSLTIRMERL